MLFLSSLPFHKLGSAIIIVTMMTSPGFKEGFILIHSQDLCQNLTKRNHVFIIVTMMTMVWYATTGTQPLVATRASVQALLQGMFLVGINNLLGCVG